MRLFRAGYVVSLLTLCLLAASAPWAAAATSERLSISPPRTAATVKPGDSYETTIKLRNGSREAFTAYVAARDLVSSDSATSFASVRAGKPSVAGTWLRPRFLQARVEPEGSLSIPVDVAVPRTASPGVYAAAIVVSRVITTPGTSTDDGARIAVTASLASQFVFTVPGDLTHDVRISRLSAPGTIWPGDPATLAVTLHNRGTAFATVDGSLDVGAFTGRAAQTIDLPEVQLLPGSRRRLSVRWTDRPTVGWFDITARLEADGRKVSRDFARVYVIPPWWIVALAGLAVALPIARWLVRRRRHHDGDD